MDTPIITPTPESTTTQDRDSAPPFTDNLFRYREEPVVLTDIDKENFFKSFISDTQYQEEVSIFGGKLKVKFTTLSVKQNNDIFKQIQIDQDNGIAKNGDAYLIRVYSYRLALTLTEIDGKQFSDIDESDKYVPNTYIKDRSDTFLKWPDFKLSAILDAFRKFNSKVTQLTMAVQEQDFWKAAV